MKELDRVQELELRVVCLMETVKKLEERVPQISSEHRKHRKRLGEIEEFLRILDHSKAREALDSIGSRVSVLGKKLQIEILRCNVVSEVGRLFPELLPQILSSLDRPDDWWREGGELTIQGWRDRLLRLQPDVLSFDRSSAAWRKLIDVPVETAAA